MNESLYDFPVSDTFKGYELEMLYGDVRAAELMPMRSPTINKEAQEVVHITQPSINVLKELKRLDDEMQEHFKSHKGGIKREGKTQDKPKGIEI